MDSAACEAVMIEGRPYIPLAEVRCMIIFLQLATQENCATGGGLREQRGRFKATPAQRRLGRRIDCNSMACPGQVNTGDNVDLPLAAGWALLCRRAARRQRDKWCGGAAGHHRGTGRWCVPGPVRWELAPSQIAACVCRLPRS